MNRTPASDRPHASPSRHLGAAIGVSAALMASIAALALAPQGCGESERVEVARAQRITSNMQLIGGPAARGEIGDYVMENDQVRVIIQDLTYNRGSGLFGGSLIDADITRLNSERDLLGGNGHDSFGELFPAFFLEVVDPEQITIVQDGSDGGAAMIEVSGRGGEFVTMLRLFNQVMVNSYDAQANIKRVLRGNPPLLDQDPKVSFSVRYILEPGARHVRVESTLRNESLATLLFPNKPVLDAITGVLGVNLGDFRVPAGHVIGLGKLNSPFLPGIGYDLQFGLLDAYVEGGVELPALPGHRTPIVATSSTGGVSYGFAIDHDPQRASIEHYVYAQDQLNQAYGGGAKPDDMLFLFYASGFGGVFTHMLPTELAPSFCAEEGAEPQTACVEQNPCGEGEEDRACEARVNACVQAWDACVAARAQSPDAFTYTSYLVIGDGDVSSIWDEIYRVRDTPVERVVGRMIDAFTGQPVGAHESVLVYEAREQGAPCAEDDSGKPLIYNQIYTKDSGIFELTLPPGQYCYRTRASGRPLSDYVAFRVAEGEDTYLEPAALAHATIEAMAVDEAGAPIPAKVTVVGTHDYVAAPDESPRRFLFDLPSGEPWRTTDMVPDVASDPETRRYSESIAYADASGMASLHVRPTQGEQRYLVYFSRGPEYEVDVREITARPGERIRVTGRLVRSVDTSGYLSGDFHLHARGSIDSGLSYNTRVLALAAEGLEVAVSTDHNYVADYYPYILSNDLCRYMTSVIGLELTTFEAGHFNGFPLRYDVESSSRGSFEWQNQPPGLIFEELRQRGSIAPDQTIVQVNHPRDTILGYFSQHNVDPITGEVQLPFLEEGSGLTEAATSPSGPAFYTVDENGAYTSTFSWNFDAIEVFNGKRTELLRHFRADRATLLPIYVDFYQQQLLGDVSGYDADDCTQARALQEQTCNTNAGADGCEQALVTIASCDGAEGQTIDEATEQATTHLARLGDQPVVVCDEGEVSHPGHLDDWFNLLNRDRPYGVRDYEEQAIDDPERLERYRQLYKRYTATGNSDSHSALNADEPGYPRNLFWVGHDEPQRMKPEELVEAIKNHRNIVTNGPMALLTINDTPIGGQVEAPDGDLSITITVRSAGWVGADRWRLVANGEIAKAGTIEMQEGQTEWSATLEMSVTKDTWFVLEVEGDQNMFPALLPSEIPPFDLNAAIGSLAGPFGFGSVTEGLAPALIGPQTPFAFTNPIWVVSDGDGQFTPPNTPVYSCQDGLLDRGGAGQILSPDALHRLGDRRLDALDVPAPSTERGTIFERLRGEDKDVRLIFESWGHHH